MMTTTGVILHTPASQSASQPPPCHTYPLAQTIQQRPPFKSDQTTNVTRFGL